jgi:hypothetical protein
VEGLHKQKEAEHECKWCVEFIPKYSESQQGLGNEEP